MSWRKLGHLYAPDGSRPWARAHAANPVAEQVDGDLYRIYFSTRDERNRSSIGWVEVDIRKPFEILAEAEEPVLRPSEPDLFDDSGVSIGCILRVGNARYLYYMGWHLAVAVRWQNALGLAVSTDGGLSFERHSRFPVVPIDAVDPHTLTYPWVMREGDRFHMWYGSSLSWGAEERDMRHVIKYAESEDGISWTRRGRVTIDLAGPEEYAICKPCVVRDADGYRMWFCARGEAYRIYTAKSADGLVWERQAEPDLTVSESGWDSEMVEYPFVFDHGGHRYLLYSGNAFGKTGFGIAIRE